MKVKKIIIIIFIAMISSFITELHVGAVKLDDLKKHAQRDIKDEEYDEAIPILQAILKYDTYNEECICSLLSCYSELEFNEKIVSFVKMRQDGIKKLSERDKIYEYYYRALYNMALYYDIINFYEESGDDCNVYVGAAYIKLGEYDKAETILKDGLEKEKSKKKGKKSEKNIIEYEAYVLCCNLLKNPQNADTIVKKFEKEFKKVSICYGLYYSKMYEKCYEYSVPNIDISRAGKQCEYLSCCTLVELGKYDEAISAYVKFSRKRHDDDGFARHDFHEEMAEIYEVYLNDKANASDKWNHRETYVKKWDDYARRTKKKGYENLGKLKESAKDFIGLPEDDKSFLVMLYNSKYRNAYAKDLISYTDYIISDIGNDIEVLRIKANLLIEFGYYEDAVSCIKLAKSNMKYDYPEFDKLLIRAYEYSGDYIKTLKLMTKYLDEYPSDYDILIEKADVLIESDSNYDGALELVESVVERYGYNQEAYRMIMYCNYKLGKYGDVKDISSQLIENNKKDHVATIYNALSLKKLGDSSYQEIIDKVNDETKINEWDRAYINALLEKNDECIKNISEVRDLNFKNDAYIRTYYVFDGLHNNNEFKTMLNVTYPERYLKKKYTKYMYIAVIATGSAFVLVVIIAILKKLSIRRAKKKYNARHKEM